MVPRSASATTEMAPGSPEAVRLVPSIGSTATSTSGPRPLPISSPKKSIGAWSFSPSPMTTVPFMSTDASDSRIASTARLSAASLLPRPWSGAAASAPASVTRSSSSARLRLVLGSSITSRENLTQAAAADRQLVGLDPQIFLAREPAIAAAVDVDARALEHGRDPHPLVSEHRFEAVDQHLVLVQLHLAQPARAAGPDLRRQLELRARAGRRAGLDRQSGGRRAGEPDPRPRRGHGRLRRQRLGRRQLVRPWLRPGRSRFRRRPARGRNPFGRLRGGPGGRRPGPGFLSPGPGRLLRRSTRRTHPRIFGPSRQRWAWV